MNSVTVKNFRCFREEQQARLAPLTLLVGENSTGKTSFLALVRALREVAFESTIPDFREPPYDLGSFDEIAYNRARGGAKSFEAGFSRETRSIPLGSNWASNETVNFSVTFEPRNGVPYPTKRRLSDDERCLEVTQDSMRLAVFDREAHVSYPERFPLRDDNRLDPLDILVSRRWLGGSPWLDLIEEWGGQIPERSYDTLSDTDKERIFELAYALRHTFFESWGDNHTFAGAPVRSTPKRTYDPTRPFRDPGGEYVPTLLANLSRRNPDEWTRLKEALEDFGRSAGLFDEIDIESLGKTDGTPFQLHVRKSAGRLKGRRRNLIDVGYGVSQILPVLIELLREDHASMALLQQPEVHLHPTAQAALGSLFCEIAGRDSQIIVETHSDYIIDRVRMDVRDKKTNLKPEDVSILYFETDGQEARIHSLELDADGNIMNAPPGYGQFFMDEMRRSIGL